MSRTSPSRLSKKQRYLQVAMNATLADAQNVIATLPSSERIIIEAGTPLIKRYGISAVRELYQMALSQGRSSIMSADLDDEEQTDLMQFHDLSRMFTQTMIDMMRHRAQKASPAPSLSSVPYIVADMKTIDRGATEVEMAAQAGASAVIAMGSAPIETLDTFIASCATNSIDAMIDMMNVDYPLSVLRALKKPPRVVILHRGVDEERENRQKMLPLHEIRRIKGQYDILIAVAGGDTPREIQSAAFNDADIVVVWKSVYTKTNDTRSLVEHFLKTIK